MRPIALSSLITIVFVVGSPTHASPPVHLWSQSHGGTSFEQVRGSAVDAAGNLYVVGQFQGTTDLGGGPLVSAGSDDIFLAKYNADGTHQWSQRFGSASTDGGYAIATDASGNLYVTGWFSSTVDFGGGGLTSAGGFDVFLAKYDSSGAHLWSQRFGNTGTDRGDGIATNGSGDVFVTGRYQGTVDFGGGALPSAGSYDVFLAKYTMGGSHIWSQRFGGTDSDQGKAVAIDGSGNVVLTATFNLTANFGGGGLVSAGARDIVLAKYDTGGTHQWSQRFGGTQDDYGREIAIDGVGNVVLTGRTGGAVDFGGGLLPFGGGVADAFVAKYDPAGAHQWSYGFGGTNYDSGDHVAVDGSGDIILGGLIQSAVDFGGGPLTHVGVFDMFVAKFDAAGAHVWSGSAGSAGTEYTTSVDVLPSNNTVVTAIYENSVDFGGGALTALGSQDIAFVRYASNPPEPQITSIDDIGNDQGRQVKVRFDRSGNDQPGTPSTITQYEAYRRDDAAPSAPGAGGGEASWRDPSGLTKPALMAEGWTYVGSAPAHGETSYGLDVPTIGDSTISSGQYYSVFYIRAATSSPYTFYDSDPDSGYSLDNLAPGVPALLVYDAGLLEWSDPTDDDFDYFTVYGSNTDDFGAATLVNYATDPSLDVTGSPYTYYYVTATDFSGNESAPGSINTLTGAGGVPQSYVLSVSNYPNPFNPSTTVKYTVPARDVVTVAIYDARGGRVATLVDREVREEGAYTVPWNGHADSGAVVTSGFYFARIEQNGAVRSKKMTLLK